MESLEAVSDGDGSGRSLGGVAVPAAQSSDDPYGPGERLRGMRVLLLEGLALEFFGERREHREMGRCEDADGLDGLAGFAAGMDALHDLDGGDQGGGGEVFE